MFSMFTEKFFWETLDVSNLDFGLRKLNGNSEVVE